MNEKKARLGLRDCFVPQIASQARDFDFDFDLGLRIEIKLPLSPPLLGVPLPSLEFPSPPWRGRGG
jgi:hypothetical protein